MIKNKFKLNDSIFEISIGLGTFATVALLFMVILVLFLLPISNYHHAPGVVEYKEQHAITSEHNGLISKVLCVDGEKVEKNRELIAFTSRENDNKIKQMEIEIAHLKKEIKLLKSLKRLGSINDSQIKLKELELSKKLNEILILSERKILSPESGIVAYSFLPNAINGAVLRKGQKVGTIYKTEEKHIRVSFPNEYADRFLIGSKVIVKYKDPISLKISRLKGVIYNKYNNVSENKIYLYCDIKNKGEKLASLQNSTTVNTSILINVTSVSEDIFNFKIPLSIHEKITDLF